MRRWILLTLLWVGGTAAATGVVFEAVVVMSQTFRDASSGSATGRRPTRTTTTVATRPPADTTATPVVTVSATSTAPSSTLKAPPDPIASTSETLLPPPTGSATSVGSGSTSATTNGRTTPTPTPAPTPTTIAPVTTAPPTAPPTTPAPTTAPTTGGTAAPADCLTEVRRIPAGPNSFSVRVCSGDRTVRLIPASIRVGSGYRPSYGSPGPQVVEVSFVGPDTYRCTVFITDDGNFPGNMCEQT